MQDVRFALRALARRPGFAALAIVTLALGIGANAAIFSVADVVLLRPLPYKDPDRLVVPWGYSAEVQQRVGFDRLPSSPGDVTDFRTRNRTFSQLGWVRSERVNITGWGDPERVPAVRVSHDFFDMLGVSPMVGRAFSATDGASPRLVLISYAFWQQRFGGARDVLGRTLRMNGEPAQIVGVMPPWFRFPAAGDLPAALGFVGYPAVWTLDILTPAQQRSRAGKSFVLVGRLRDGETRESAEADLAAIAADIARDFPGPNGGWTVRVMTLREQLVGGVRTPLLVLLAAVGLVLLIACANVANLLLVRAAARQREMSIRHALGADRSRLVVQMLVESLIMAVLAGAAGLLVAWLGLRTLLALSPATLPALSAAGLDWRLLMFTLLVSIATGLLFGVVPALQATRGDVSDGLREGSRGSVASRRANRTRGVLVVLEVALAVVLLVGALLLVRTFVRLLSVDAGFRTDGILTMEVSLPRAAYQGPRSAEFFERLVARLSQIPGVQSAAVTSALPLTGPENLRQVTIEGRPRPEPGQEIISDYRVITPEYFDIMGIPRLSGEMLRAPAAPDVAPMLLINATMARVCWPGEDPVGKRLKMVGYADDGPWFTVAGVVGDTRHTALDSSLRPQVYVHQREDPFLQMVVVLRTSTAPEGFVGTARAAVQEIDPNQPAGRVRTMKAVVGESVATRRFTMSLVGTFAALAFVLSIVGLYAVVSHSVAERTREIGLRVALGAQPADLMRLVLGEGLRLAGIGIGVGLAGAFILTRFIEALLFGVAPRDVLTFVSVPLVLMLAALLGCLIPARRAMRVDPMNALRAE